MEILNDKAEEAEIGLQDGRPPEISRMWVTMLQLLQDNPLYASTGHGKDDGNGPRRSFFFFFLFYSCAHMTELELELELALPFGQEPQRPLKL